MEMIKYLIGYNFHHKYWILGLFLKIRNFIDKINKKFAATLFCNVKFTVRKQKNNNKSYKKKKI
jgi:hypothetical protein